MTDKQINKLAHIATYSKSDTEANAAMKKLKKINPTYHWCCEWDFLVICDKDREFECCACFDKNSDVA